MSHPRPSPDAIARMRYDAAAKSPLIAYLLWFFLGYGGVHRMYLGRWISGILMLLLFGLSLLLTLVLIGYLGLGLIALWWVIDALLIPGMARRANERLIARLAG
ncbi:TM2 domain-containing protein [Rubritepida flocculans]|uniref:TM2 domain-containing protein n=1 Tax=Rubritepida flocculans TaxID=182403 RepID=UPI0004168392|nr:TM2 domain-containing protein [Rubritepida flocculans]